jgi:hypothetical protein
MPNYGWRGKKKGRRRKKKKKVFEQMIISIYGGRGRT